MELSFNLCHCTSLKYGRQDKSIIFELENDAIAVIDQQQIEFWSFKFGQNSKSWKGKNLNLILISKFGPKIDQFSNIFFFVKVQKFLLKYKFFLRI